jgi:hypothetical protein
MASGSTKKIADQIRTAAQPVVLVLGLGASVESGQEKTEAALDHMIADLKDDSGSYDVLDKYGAFYSLLKDKPRDDRRTLLARFFEIAGVTEGYDDLADLIMEGYFGLIVTTNVDTMLEEALQEAKIKRPGTFVIGRNPDDTIGSWLSIRGHDVKIVKLRGSLDSPDFTFPPDRMVFNPHIQEALQRETRKSLLFVGYTRQDRAVLDLVNSIADHAIWWVSYHEPTWRDADDRPVLQLLRQRKSDDNILSGEDARFENFFSTLYETLTGAKMPPRLAVVWDRLEGSSKRQTDDYLRMYTNKEYIPDLFARRTSIEEEMAKFLGSDHEVGLVLLARAGRGKTNLLCSLAEDWTTKGHLVLAFDCGVRRLKDLQGDIKTALDVGEDMEFGQFLAQVNRLAERHDKRVVIIFDSLNDWPSDNPRPEKLLARIDELIRICRYPRIKVILTCRTATWERLELNRQTRLSWNRYYAGEPLTLRRFDDKEFREAYGRYRKHYDLQTDYETLTRSRETSEMCRDPLILRLVSETHEGGEIPPQPLTAQVFETYYGEIVPAEYITGLEVLVGEMIKRKRSMLSQGTVEQILGEPASSRLKDTGVLTEFAVERPAGRMVRFTYSRFFEYLVASHYVRMDRNGDIALTGELLTRLLDKSRGFPALWEAAKDILVMRASAELCLALSTSGHTEAITLVARSLETLFFEAPQRCAPILERLIADESEQAQEAALRAARLLPPTEQKARELFVRALGAESEETRKIASDILYLEWEENPGFTYGVMHEVTSRITLRDAFRPALRRALVSCLNVTWWILGNHCDDIVIEEMSELWQTPAKQVFQAALVGGAAAKFVKGILLDRTEKAIATLLGSLEEADLDRDISDVMKAILPSDEARSSFEQVVEFLDPNKPGLEEHLDSLKILLEQESPSALAPVVAELALVVHTANDFDNMVEKSIKPLFDQVNAYARAFMIAGFCIFLPIFAEDVMDKYVVLLEELTERGRSDEETRALFMRREEHPWPMVPKLNLGLVPLGFAYCMNGVYEMPHIRKLIEESRQRKEWAFHDRCIFSLGGIGFRHPDPVLDILEEVLKDEVAVANIESLPKALGIVREAHRDKVDAFLDSIPAGEEFRREISALEPDTISDMRYYIEKLGTWNFLVYGCLVYPGLRNYLVAMLQVFTSASGPLRDALLRIVDSIWDVLREKDWSLADALSYGKSTEYIRSTMTGAPR